MSSLIGFVRGGLAVAVLGLAACGGGDYSPGALVSGGRDLEAEQRSAALYAAVAICPKVSIREGTQVLPIYASGRRDDPAAMNFQASLTRTSRECRTDTATGVTTISVGVAGRVLAGPSGATGTVDLPVRVVLLKNGTEVISSTLHHVSVNVTAEQPSVMWTLVDSALTVSAADASAPIDLFVGFDDMADNAR